MALQVIGVQGGVLMAIAIAACCCYCCC